MVDVVKPQVMPNVQGRSFLASSIGFTTGPGGRAPFTVLSNFDSIRDNLRNILFFRKGDYLDDPDFGVGLQDFVFDNEGEQFNLPLAQEIRRQVGKYEKRAVIRQCNVFTPRWMDDAVMVDLDLLIGGFNFQGSASALGSFSLKRTT